MDWYVYLILFGAALGVLMLIRHSRRVHRQRQTYLANLTINGKHVRPVDGNCPGCGVSSKLWCMNDCPYIDPMDYR